MSERDLKTQNIYWLAAIYATTLGLVSLVHWTVEEVFTISVRLGQQALVVAAITGFAGMLSNFLPNSVKHGLVYFRVTRVLPGHRCKRLCTRDPRLTVTVLERMWPDLFLGHVDESNQNAYWYKEIYRPVRNSPEVLQAHRSFLMFRDAASGLFVLLIGLLLWRALAQIAPLAPVSLWSSVIVGLVVLLFCQAAQQSGNRMVTNAVAVAIGEEQVTG